MTTSIYPGDIADADCRTKKFVAAITAAVAVVDLLDGHCDNDTLYDHACAVVDLAGNLAGEHNEKCDEAGFRRPLDLQFLEPLRRYVAKRRPVTEAQRRCFVV